MARIEASPATPRAPARYGDVSPIVSIPNPRTCIGPVPRAPSHPCGPGGRHPAHRAARGAGRAVRRNGGRNRGHVAVDQRSRLPRYDIDAGNPRRGRRRVPAGRCRARVGEGRGPRRRWELPHRRTTGPDRLVSLLPLHRDRLLRQPVLAGGTGGVRRAAVTAATTSSTAAIVPTPPIARNRR